jgi:hypothetical protein
MPVTRNFGNKKVLERKHFKGVPLVWSYFPLEIFENQILGSY